MREVDHLSLFKVSGRLCRSQTLVLMTFYMGWIGPGRSGGVEVGTCVRSKYAQSFHNDATQSIYGPSRPTWPYPTHINVIKTNV